ncbi:MAG: hypothetical protein NC548_26450 [Lachnospiraceae bacterium]|nr:hypothetical protein [Lachnospiraceae bacterium]
MNNPILLTPQDIINAALAICAAITAIASASAVIAKIVVSAKRPNKVQDEKIAALEEEVERIKEEMRESEKKLDRRFSADKSRLDSIDEANAVTQTAILALLSHALNGNDKEALQRAKADLETYLTHRPHKERG